jgi:DNA-binding CsgD family transcriptional regulator
MVMDVAFERAAAKRLVGRGDISRAMGTLRRVAEASDDPEDRLLLGRVAYVAIDFAEAQAQLEHAYRDFQSRGLPRRAAMAAVALGQLPVDGLEDPVVGRGWLARALRLLEHEEPCLEKGYAVIGLMGASVASAEELEASARLALDFDLAAAAARQALRQLRRDQLRSASLLLTLVEAELGRGNADAAGQAAAQLRQLSEGAELPSVAAQAALALGKTSVARGEPGLAARDFEAGLATLPADSWPLLRAALHLELARAWVSKAAAEATVNAQAALSIYQRLGAPEASAAADLLRAQGVPVTVAPPPPTGLEALSPREREVLALVAQGESNPAIGKRLVITEKTAEHHVSSILGKLGLRNRAEAAAFAASFHFSEEGGRGVLTARRSRGK